MENKSRERVETYVGVQVEVGGGAVSVMDSVSDIPIPTDSDTDGRPSDIVGEPDGPRVRWWQPGSRYGRGRAKVRKRAQDKYPTGNDQSQIARLPDSSVYQYYLLIVQIDGRRVSVGPGPRSRNKATKGGNGRADEQAKTRSASIRSEK